MRHNGDRRPQEIQAEIERTRAEMDGTLSAIEQRLTPGQLVDQGLDYLRHSGAEEFASNLGGSVKQNPLPVALVGIGLAWLMALGRNPAQHGGAMSSRHLGERAGDTMHRASQAAGSARQKIGETAQSARARAGQIGETARARAGQLGDTASREMARARSGIEHMVKEQPLALGAIGLAIGAVLAAAAPRSRQEDELMGEARDRLAERAAETGREQLEKAERVAGAAADAAKEAAKDAVRQAPPAR
jgi:ElaB/YqjD/DUF883 family membrane-anchored ribosome-binding protein